MFGGPFARSIREQLLCPQASAGAHLNWTLFADSRYTRTTRQWVWLMGPNAGGASPVYGTRLSAGAAVTPGGELCLQRESQAIVNASLC
jgi:hypothetical protein